MVLFTALDIGTSTARTRAWCDSHGAGAVVGVMSRVPTSVPTENEWVEYQLF